MITTWKWAEEDKLIARIKPVVDNNVFILDVSVENASCVQKVYCSNHLSGNGTNVYILSIMKKFWLIFGGLPEYKAGQRFVHDRVSVNELEQVHVSMFFHHHLITKVVWIIEKCGFLSFYSTWQPEHKWDFGRRPKLLQCLTRGVSSHHSLLNDHEDQWYQLFG